MRAALESRRRKYLRYFYAGLLAGSCFLASAFFYPEAALHLLQRPLKVKTQLKPSDIAAYRAFAVLCALSLGLSPVMNYRSTRGLSVGHAVLSRLLNLFGAFIPASGGGISSAELKASGYATAPFLFYPEEGASGEMNFVRLRMCEASLLARNAEGKDRLVFHGLVILCDALAKAAKASPATRPNPEFMHEQLAQVAAVQEILSAMRWDEKLLYAMQGFYVRTKEALISGAGRDELPSEKLYRLKYHLPQRLTRYGQPENQDALITSYSVEYSERSCLVLVAGVTGFFELGSLFAPAWSELRARRFFEIMQMLDSVTGHLPSRT